MKINSDQILALAETAAHIGHWSWNFDTQEVFWSPECFNIFGRDPDTWIPTGENFRGDMPDEDREKLEEANLRGFEGGAPFQLEYRYFRGGSRDDVRWIRVFCDFLIDTGGTNHMVGISQDITENRLLFDQLQKKTLQLSKAQEISKVGHWNLDATTMEVSGSDELSHIFGIGSDEATLNAFVEVVHPEDREYDLAHIQRGLETGQSWDIEHRLLRRDGSIRHIRATGEATLNEEGSVESLFGTVQDITDRVKILKALQESEERLQSVTSNLPGALFRRVMHRDGTLEYPYMSGGIHDFLGITPEEFMAHPEMVSSFFHPDDLRVWQQVLEASATDLSPVAVELRFRLPTGGYGWVRQVTKVRRAENGDIIWDGIGIDITEERRAREALRESRDRIRLIADNLPVFISYFDAEQRLRFVNKAAQEMYARPEEEILGCTIGEIRSPEVDDQLSAHIEAALSGKEQHFEQTRAYPDGKTRAVETSYVPHLNQSGEVQGCFALVQDFTERKRAEAALRESEARYRALVELSPDAVYVHQNGRIIFANKSTMSLLTASRANDIVGKLVLDFVAPQDHARARARISRTLTTGQATPLAEFKMIRLDDVAIDVAIASRAIEWEGGRAVLVVVHDVSDQKAKEREIRLLNEGLERRVQERTEELRKAQDELVRQARLATLGQLTASVSHELRNPLGVIRTSTFIVSDKLQIGDPLIRRALERIERSVVRCDRIIDELLDFTRISKLEFESTPIDTWLEETLSEQTLPSGVTLRSELDMPDMAVQFDRDRFRRAIINVFDNGCQAMVGEGREDTVSEDHTLTVRTREHGGRIEVIFEDTGPGIPPDVYEKIFEPLYSTKGFGVGLGLPVVRQIMEQHGGGIEIESEEGRGTQVCLWLPTSPTTR